MFFRLFSSVSLILTYVFYQSADWPHPAAPAPTLKSVTANMSLFLANTAAAASAQPGSTLLVSLTRPLEPDSGRSPQQLVLQMAVATRVRDVENTVKHIPFVEFNLKD